MNFEDNKENKNVNCDVKLSEAKGENSKINGSVSSQEKTLDIIGNSYHNQIDLSCLNNSLKSYNMFDENSKLIESISSLQRVVEILPQKNNLHSVANLLLPMFEASDINQINSINNSLCSSILKLTAMTPEIENFQKSLKMNIENATSSFTAISSFVNDLSIQWEQSLKINDIFERSIAVQNIAVLRMIPDYQKFELPYGSKSVLKSLNKETAEELAKTKKIQFDPKERNFYHKDFPGHRITADSIKVIQSSQELFSDISLDELIEFESQLYNDLIFAICHPVGEKIYKIIQNWNNFVSFEEITYYHARKLENGKCEYLDQEMMKAPQNISGHGRYNAIGKSCYYISETKEGAVSEIIKHCGGVKTRIQILGLKAKKPVKMIDLSEEIKGRNTFIEHLRYSVENDNDQTKIKRAYLLPNFVASCCKRIGIDGIRYMSTGYKCCVLWDDDYFDIVKGSREIIEN